MSAWAKTPRDARPQVVVAVRRQLEVGDVVLLGSTHVVHVGAQAITREIKGHSRPGWVE